MYAKRKLNFDNLDELKDVKKISALKDIQQEVMSGTMPPEKYINKHPEKKITKDEKEIINKWVTKELNAIQEKVNND